jgi:TRAP-type C4-dicarboxylate transport system permease large subunit
MLLLVPILVPTIVALGYDLIWFGVVMVIMVEMGQITPPIGLNVFVLHGANPDIPMYTIFNGIWPFVVAMLVCLAILLAFPQIALFLPSLGG